MMQMMMIKLVPSRITNNKYSKYFQFYQTQVSSCLTKANVIIFYICLMILDIRLVLFVFVTDLIMFETGLILFWHLPQYVV
jgi:hypothetical protein